MSDPTNPSGDWQQVPSTPPDPSNVPPASAAGYPPPPQGGYQPPPNYPPQGPPGYAPQAAGLSSTSAAAISYLTFIPAVIFLVMDPYKRDPFVRFHAIQCIALTVVWFVVAMVMSMLAGMMLFANGGFGTLSLFGLLYWCVRLVVFIVWLICIVSASQGKWFKLPVIGDIAMKMSQK
jgi:uncharacterized membrane protein